MEGSNMSIATSLSEMSWKGDMSDPEMSDTEEEQLRLLKEKSSDVKVHQFYMEVDPAFGNNNRRPYQDSDRPESALTDVTLDEDDAEASASPQNGADENGSREKLSRVPLKSRDTTRTLGLSSGLTGTSDGTEGGAQDGHGGAQHPQQERTEISTRSVRFEGDKSGFGTDREISDLTVTTVTLSVTDDSMSLPRTADGNRETTMQGTVTGEDSTGVFSTAVDEDSIKRGRGGVSTEDRKSTLFEPEKWHETPSQSTKGPSLTEIINSRAHEHYCRGLDLMQDDLLDEAVCALTKAIALVDDVTEFYVQRAECYLLQCDFQSAILNYKKACVLEPDNDRFYSRLAFIYFFLGQTLFDQKLYPEALECFSRAAEMRPDHIGYQTRSVTCLAALNRHGECLALVNKRLESEQDNPDLFVMRARLHEMFKNTTLCYYDVRDALELDPEHSEALAMMKQLQTQAEEFKNQSVRLALIGRFREALQKISAAVETNPTSASFHNLRGSLHRRLSDFTAAIDDFLLAMDKTDHDEESEVYKEAQRQLLLTYNDFAIECFSKGFYEEAIILLNRAIKAEKAEFGLYVNRGDCFYRQDELTFALQDFQQALEMSPQADEIRSRIGVIHNDYGTTAYDQKNFGEAESRFTLALQHAPRVPSYYVSRARARFMMEKNDLSREDALTTLILEPGNKELASLMSRLFPGSTVNDVMCSPLAQEVRRQVEHLVPRAGGIKLKPLSRTTSAAASLSTHSTDDSQSEAGTSRRTQSAVDYVSGADDTESVRPMMSEKQFNVQVVKEKQKLHHKIKSHYHDAESRVVPRGPKVLPLPGAVKHAQRGGALFKHVAKPPDKPKKKSSTNWKTISRGVGVGSC